MPSHPHLTDPDGAIERGIQDLQPDVNAINETPRGRLAGIDYDTSLVYQEMYELLTGRVTPINTQAYEQCLNDLAGLLGDLHRRGAQAFEEVIANQRPRGCGGE